MTLNDEIEILDEKFKKMNMPFDKGLPILQDLVGKLLIDIIQLGPKS